MRIAEVLAYLVEHHDRVVTKYELLNHIWTDTYIDECAVAQCIGALRQALGDCRSQQQMIRTVHSQGYRFVTTVKKLAPSTAVSEPVDKQPMTNDLDETISLMVKLMKSLAPENQRIIVKHLVNELLTEQLSDQLA